MDAFDISASGLTAQRLRLDIIASNLANMNSTRQADGSLGAYRRKNVVFGTLMPGQGSTGSSANGATSQTTQNGETTLKASVSYNQNEGIGVQVVQIAQDDNTPLKRVYDPAHPDADANGYVEMPNINPVTEMVDMISATRAYEANVSAIQSSKSMGRAALDI